MFRNLVATLAVLIFVGPVLAQPTPQKPDDKTLVTKVYDLKPLLGERGKSRGIADMDAVIKQILDVIPVGVLKPGTDGPLLIERDGGKLEVRATEKMQQEIGDLIESLLRLTDLAVDVKAEVLEFDAAAYDKWLKSIPASAKGKAGSPVVFFTRTDEDEKEPTDAEKRAYAETSKLLRAGKPIQTATARFANGVESTFSARQSVQTFHPQMVNKKPPEPPQFAKEGFKLVGTPVVSADRRFIRLKLTEQSVRVTGIKKRDLGEVIEGQKLVLTSLETEDLGATGSTTIADGGTVVHRLAYAPEDKVWLVVLQPTIFIQAEEDVLKKQEKK
jgi:hypothetical protein